MLLALIAHCTDRYARDLIISFGDLHIYKNHLAQVEEQLDRDPYPLPRLRLSNRLAGSGADGLLSAKWEDVELVGYQHHPKLEAPVAV